MLQKTRTLCLSCDIEIGKKAKKYCSVRCQTEFQYRSYVERWKQGLETGVGETGNLSHHLRRYLVETYGERCAVCGWAERNPKSGLIAVTLHHKDGNWRNNTEDNLEFLCPNHHSLTTNYGMLNKGNGRAFRLKSGD